MKTQPRPAKTAASLARALRELAANRQNSSRQVERLRAGQSARLAATANPTRP